MACGTHAHQVHSFSYSLLVSLSLSLLYKYYRYRNSSTPVDLDRGCAADLFLCACEVNGYLKKDAVKAEEVIRRVLGLSGDSV
jgi:hypothetical protein